MSDSPLLDSGVETAVESNASNGLFNLESNTVESPVPEVYWTTFLQSFAAETVSFGDVAHFVLQYAHHRLPLVWPSGAELRFASSEMLGISEDEVCKLTRNFVCCPFVDVWVIGLVLYSDLSALMLIGDRGEFYAFNRSVDNAIYRVADTPYGLWKRGLRRFDPVYAFFESIVSGGFFFGPMCGVEDVLNFAVAFDKALVPLPWPKGVLFEFSVPEDHGERWRFIPRRGVAVLSESLSEDASVVVFFESNGFLWIAWVLSTLWMFAEEPSLAWLVVLGFFWPWAPGDSLKTIAFLIETLGPCSYPSLASTFR